jgi:hypothetical protein
MTDTITQAVVKMTRDEAKILAHYAANESPRQIADTTGIDFGTVGLTIDALCGNNRNLARNLATEWQLRATAVAAAKPVSAPPRVPTPAPAPAPIRAKPQPAQPWELQVDDIASMLDAAQTSGNPKLARAATKIRDLVADLQEHLAEHSRGARLRQEQADLEARLAAIKEQLRGRRGPILDDPAPTGAPAAAEPKKVRAWAAANGVTCNAHGRVPTQVVDAYRKAVAAS